MKRSRPPPVVSIQLGSNGDQWLFEVCLFYKPLVGMDHQTIFQEARLTVIAEIHITYNEYIPKLPNFIFLLVYSHSSRSILSS